MRLMLDESSRDYTYYRDKEWFESDYYYPVRLGALKKAAGTLFDWTANRVHKKKGELASAVGSVH